MSTSAIICIVLLVGIVAYLFGVHQTSQMRKDFNSLFFSQYAGIFPVFCDGPNDTKVLERAKLWEDRFKAHGNETVIVIAYPYNKVLETGKGTETTITHDYQSTMVMYCKDFINAVENLHLTAAKTDPLKALKFLAAQEMTQR